MHLSWVQSLIPCGLMLLGLEFVQAGSLSDTTRPKETSQETSRPKNVKPTDMTEVGTEIGDVKLDATGLLRGVVINLRGVPVANAIVAIRKADGKVVRTATDAFGCFAVDGLLEGTYQLTSGHLVRRIRTWVAAAAPPRAGQLALIVLGDNVVRGHGIETESGPDNTVLRTGMRLW